jgi:hypothetical protein
MPDFEGVQFQTKGRHQYLTTGHRGVRVLVEGGSEVTITPGPLKDLTETRSILMAPVQAVLWHQRGFLPLHASVVGADGGAIALAGPSGAGKSTLAAVLSRKGCDVLADDICIIDASGQVDVLASGRRLRLWPDALDFLGIAKQGLPRALSRREKYLIDGNSLAGPQRLKLAAIVLLSRSEGEAVTIERRKGARSVMEQRAVVLMLNAARALGLEPAVFKALTKLQTSGVTVWSLKMPDDSRSLNAAADAVLSILGD